MKEKAVTGHWIIQYLLDAFDRSFESVLEHLRRTISRHLTNYTEIDSVIGNIKLHHEKSLEKHSRDFTQILLNEVFSHEIYEENTREDEIDSQIIEETNELYSQLQQERIKNEYLKADIEAALVHLKELEEINSVPSKGAEIAKLELELLKLINS